MFKNAVFARRLSISKSVNIKTVAKLQLALLRQMVIIFLISFCLAVCLAVCLLVSARLLADGFP
jgi:hypothetical protein